MILDMHCHLDLYAEPFEVARKCQELGVFVLSVTTTPKAWKGTKKLEFENSKIRTAIGLHPQVASQRIAELDLFDEILPRTKYVGEIGLDGGKDFSDSYSIQLKAFRHILSSVNKSGGKVMSIHCRHSAKAVLDELENIDGTPILHWFSGSKSELKRAISRGCYFSIGPNMLCSKKGQEILSLIPTDKILTETDGPFGKYNRKILMPWDASIANDIIADNLGFSKEEMNFLIRSNLKKLLE